VAEYRIGSGRRKVAIFGWVLNLIFPGGVEACSECSTQEPRLRLIREGCAECEAERARQMLVVWYGSPWRRGRKKVVDGKQRSVVVGDDGVERA